MNATISDGNENTASMQLTSAVQVKTGRRSIVIPGARRRRMVTSTQAAIRIDPRVARPAPQIHRSMPGPGVVGERESGS